MRNGNLNNVQEIVTNLEYIYRLKIPELSDRMVTEFVLIINCYTS